MLIAELQLREGEYVFQVTVSASGKYGEATVNVTVLPRKYARLIISEFFRSNVAATRENKSPVAVVKPIDQEVQLPNDVVIDGSSSTDDDKIVLFHWEKVTGPMDSSVLKDNQMEKSMLVLQNLTPGTYTFK
jgi:hypothetical protein